MKKDAALSEFLQISSNLLTEPLWAGKGEILNEVLKAPGSVSPAWLPATVLLYFACREK